MSNLHIPAFATEAEEAAWWDSNREAVSEELAQAAREGRLRRRAEHADDTVGVPKLTLNEEDLLRAHEAARRRGITLLEYVRLAVHEALARESAA